VSCPDCQRQGSGRALWFVLIALLFVGIVAVASCASASPANVKWEPSTRS
jgi:hypothetical protein